MARFQRYGWPVSMEPPFKLCVRFSRTQLTDDRYIFECGQAAQLQSGADQQHQRQPHLGHYQGGAQMLAAGEVQVDEALRALLAGKMDGAITAETIREVLVKLDAIAPVTMVEVAPVDLASYDRLCEAMEVQP